MNRPADQWIRWTTSGYVALTPLTVDGMIVAASTVLLADSRAGSEAAWSYTPYRIDEADQFRRGDR